MITEDRVLSLVKWFLFLIFYCTVGEKLLSYHNVINPKHLEKMTKKIEKNL